MGFKTQTGGLFLQAPVAGDGSHVGGRVGLNLELRRVWRVGMMMCLQMVVMLWRQGRQGFNRFKLNKISLRVESGDDCGDDDVFEEVDGVEAG
jgi:hypothetical protein